MPRPIRFENHLSKRVIEIFFDEGFDIVSREDLDDLKNQWMANLKKWHSPYTCVLDCRRLKIDPSMQADFARLIDFFKKFFMKKIVGFSDGTAGAADPSEYPFPVHRDYAAAIAETGLGREGGLGRDLTRLRDRIQIDSDFSAHVIEVSFLAPTAFETSDDVRTLREKIQNTLMQWHTPYSLVFNVENCRFNAEAKAAFAALERFVSGFFCQAIVGYGVSAEPEGFPFKVFRARHKAVGTLSHQGLQTGDSANCGSRRRDKPDV